MYKIYMLTAPDGRKYVGVTKRTLKQRFQDGLGYVHNYKETSIIAKAIVYFGWKNFNVDILQTTEDEKNAYELEKYYIDLYGTTETNKGFNTQNGGKDGYTFNSDFKKRVRGVHNSINTEFKMGHACFTCHPFVCLQNGKTYMTKEQAEKDLGIKLFHVYDICKGRRNNEKGYTFVYCEDYKKLPR